MKVPRVAPRNLLKGTAFSVLFSTHEQNAESFPAFKQLASRLLSNTIEYLAVEYSYLRHSKPRVPKPALTSAESAGGGAVEFEMSLRKVRRCSRTVTACVFCCPLRASTSFPTSFPYRTTPDAAPAAGAERSTKIARHAACARGLLAVVVVVAV
jgi:hypothetical protein